MGIGSSFPPALRIATLLAFAALCAALGATAVAALGTTTAVATAFVPGASRALAALVWRSRWLLATVVSLNAFATPGAAAWADAPSWAPSAAGLTLAAHRGAVLLAMLAAVNLLLRTTPSAALVEGITGLARPFAALGLEPERLGARLGGALALLGATQQALRERATAGGWRDAIAERVLAIEAGAER